jgi:hypothetical protein
MIRAVTSTTVKSAAAIALVVMAAQAYSQAYVGNGYNPYGYYNGGHASTAAEGYANGLGNVLQSAGSYNLQTSQAAINLTQAQKQNIDNHVAGTQAYFEMRKINQDSRKALDTPGLTTEDSWRIAQANLPKRPTQMQLDPVTGRIYWPIGLQAPQFQKYRQQLDSLFVQRETSHGGIGYETFMQIQDVTDAMLTELKKNINQYKSGDYIQLKNFVEGLAYEAKFPAV